MTAIIANVDWKRVPIEKVYLSLYDGPHATPKPASEGPVFLGIKNITEEMVDLIYLIYVIFQKMIFQSGQGECCHAPVILFLPMKPR